MRATSMEVKPVCPVVYVFEREREKERDRQ